MSTEMAPLEPQQEPAATTLPSVTQLPNPVRAANPLDLAPSEFRQALARRSENRGALIDWIRGALVDGVDYGAVPLRRGGYSKPSLRKPGAEKICGMLGVTASFPTLKDYEAAALDGREVRHIILRCHLATADGQVVADGVGARAVEQDQGDLNKSLKMAVKSAMIDATLRMAGLSEIFTQDLEDMPQPPVEAEPTDLHARDTRHEERAPRRELRHTEATPAASVRERLATERQVKLLRVRLERGGIAERELTGHFGIEELAALPFSQVNAALHWIETLTR